MRTKTILLTAALVAAGVASSMAQSSNVYSLNVVGYVNVTIPNGFTILNTPLDSGNNVDTNLFPNAANGEIIYTFGPSGFISDNYDNGWSGAGTQLQPGTGYFFYNPSANPITNTFVGTVIQGTTTNALVAGFTLVGPTAPISGTADTNGFPAINGTIVYEYTSSGYVSYNYDNGWSPSAPPISPGAGFFSFQPVAANWVETFTVQ